MAVQPASGSKDLNPKQVERNHLLSKNLSQVYRLWGYEEVTPPRVERLETLMAGGAIGNKDIAKVVADEPLGLRPEMTASIARAACTRLAERPRPLRLWASGTIFECRESVEGGLCIEENLQSGVELFGIPGINAEIELLSLLLDGMEKLQIDDQYEPKLLIGHTTLFQIILASFGSNHKEKIKNSLLNYDRLTLENLNLEFEIKDRILNIQSIRGKPSVVLNQLEILIGKNTVIEDLKSVFSIIEPIASEHNIGLQLDPTFQPHFELYTGIVFHLICKGHSAPVVVARGGRYDLLVKQFGAEGNDAAGLGFSFAIDKIREILQEQKNETPPVESILITYSSSKKINQALQRQQYWHEKGIVALLELEPYPTKKHAVEQSKGKGIRQVEWIE